MLPRLLSITWGNLVFHLNGYGFSIFCGTLAALLISLRRAREHEGIAEAVNQGRSEQAAERIIQHLEWGKILRLL